MEGHRRKTRRGSIHREVWGVIDRSKRKDRMREMLRNAKKRGERSGALRENTGGLREEIGVKPYFLHRPVDYPKTLKIKFRVRDLDLPERRKTYRR